MSRAFSILRNHVLIFLFSAGMSSFAVADVIIDSNVTWDTSINPRVISERIQIIGGGRLEIEPGVILKFRSASFSPAIHVHSGGILMANGVIFTSYFDDTVGGNTDGSSRIPQVGDFSFFRFEGNAESMIDHCQIRYGHSISVIRGNLNVRSSVLEYGYS